MIHDKDIKAFRKHVRALSKLMRRMRSYNPEARYCLAWDNLNLMDGSPHTSDVAHHENVVACENFPADAGSG